MFKVNNRRWIPIFIILVLLLLAGTMILYQFLVSSRRETRAGVNRVVFVSGKNTLVVEALDDDLVHFEYTLQGNVTPDQPIPSTPMVLKTDYPGPKRFTNNNQGLLETNELSIQVSTNTLCVRLTNIAAKPAQVLTQACPESAIPGRLGAMTLTQEGTQDLYGLGEAFVSPDSESLNWLGKQRLPGNDMGNAMDSFMGGAVGNAQFPILYALGAEKSQNYAVFIDSQYALSWEFRKTPWEIYSDANDLRWYAMTGPDLPDLRHDFMELVGKPPVPPKKMFGLWVSEFGYDNWNELEDKLKTLRANQFPIDGFVLDLQWFGGITPIEISHMGNVNWDTTNFPDPPGKIADLAKRGIGLITIEESYVAEWLPEFEDMQNRGYLVKSGANGKASIITNGWWGTGGMIDWTNPAGSDYWHNLKRQPLIDMGILGHWTDLGEPEMYTPDGYYYGAISQDLNSEQDNHNLYNFRWSESIARGYQRNQVQQRPFILSRSGTAGIQRFGDSMWSGDIGSNLFSLAAHLTVQAHMSLSGIDFFGSDIGGFHRETAGTDIDQIYTKWFAIDSLIDVPVRPHTENLCNCKETAPDRIGDVKSNLANLRLRYALSPYLYSLAHQASLTGDPVIPPLVYYYQDDTAARTIADEKLIGQDLLVAAIPSLGAESRDVYLPAGSWVNFYTNEWIDSKGEQLKNVSAIQNGLFQLPLFARAGAIIPMMFVDEHTLNILGLRDDDATHDELIARVYASPDASSFTLYEDDGQTIAYQQGQVRTTLLHQQLADQIETVTIEAADGTYQGASDQRDNIIQLVSRNLAQSVKLNGLTLPQLSSQAELDSASQGWFQAGPNLVIVKTGKMDVKVKKEVVVILK